MKVRGLAARRGGWALSKNAAALVALVALAGGATACTIGEVGGQEDTAQSSGDGQGEQDVEKLTIEASVEDGDTGHNPAEPVTVNVTGGTLKDVEMVNENGMIVESTLSDDATSWTTAEVLGYNRQYTLTIVDSEGEEQELSFSTATPAATTGVAIGPLPDSAVGIGQAITFVFSVAPTDREAVEEAITVETSNDTEGGFYWFGDNDLRWRPAEFWEPGTEVTVSADIYGLDMGGGVFGAEDNATNFTIGDDVRAIVDDSTKTMKVYQNGELLRSIPVSLGRDGGRWATPNGTYVVGDEHTSLLMDSETFGLSVADGGYSTPVNYATQMSYSGIYVHGAPWSVWAQGNTNTSHGCVNVSDADAAWFQDVVKRGDPVIVQNTSGGTLPEWDGLGHWNLDWETWKAGNA